MQRLGFQNNKHGYMTYDNYLLVCSSDFSKPDVWSNWGVSNRDEIVSSAAFLIETIESIKKLLHSGGFREDYDQVHTYSRGRQQIRLYPMCVTVIFQRLPWEHRPLEWDRRRIRYTEIEEIENEIHVSIRKAEDELN